jgi:hypothetical protein
LKTEYPSTEILCSVCVQAQEESDDPSIIERQKSELLHQYLGDAARLAVELKWDLGKFQDESGAYFLVRQEKLGTDKGV